MTTQKFIFFISLILLSFQSKAIALATLPSTLSDTCVEINLKSGSKIIAKITKKTQEKVYFKKCDNLADTTSYFVLQEKISSIKTYDGKAKEFQENKPNPNTERKNKAKRERIWILFGVCMLSGFFMLLTTLVPFAGLLGILMFLVGSIWGLVEVTSYNGTFDGKAFLTAWFISQLVGFLLLLLLVIVLLS